MLKMRKKVALVISILAFFIFIRNCYSFYENVSIKIDISKCNTFLEKQILKSHLQKLLSDFKINNKNPYFTIKIIKIEKNKSKYLIDYEFQMLGTSFNKVSISNNTREESCKELAKDFTILIIVFSSRRKEFFILKQLNKIKKEKLDNK